MRSHSFEPLSQININSCFIHTNFPEKNFTNLATRMSNYCMKKFLERKYKSQRADTLVRSKKHMWLSSRGSRFSKRKCHFSFRLSTELQQTKWLEYSDTTRWGWGKFWLAPGKCLLTSKNCLQRNIKLQFTSPQLANWCDTWLFLLSSCTPHKIHVQKVVRTFKTRSECTNVSKISSLLSRINIIVKCDSA